MTPNCMRAFALKRPTSNPLSNFDGLAFCYLAADRSQYLLSAESFSDCVGHQKLPGGRGGGVMAPIEIVEIGASTVI